MHERHDDILTAAEILEKATSVLFITGAGVSADSGMPTYRGIGGLYRSGTTEDGLPIEVILSGEVFRARPRLTWKYLLQIARAQEACVFNRAHAVMAEIEQTKERVCTLTQNIDGFHRAAGSKNIIDIHGDLHDLMCTACTWRTRLGCSSELEAYGHPPSCPECGAVVRPDVVLFGEMLPVEKLERLERELRAGFDVVFSIGTTSVFPYIAEPVVRAARAGKPTIEINPEKTVVSGLVTIHLQRGAAEALDAMWGEA